MTTIELLDVKDQLPQIVDRAGEGETFTITRNGVPVAQLTGAAAEKRANIRETIERMKASRKTRPAVSHEEIREMIEEGRA